MGKITPHEALDMEFWANDRDEQMTFRAYFNQLLSALFEEGESFSGKRPFGNSGWDYGLALGVVEIGAVPGTEDGPEDEGEANQFIFDMIDALCAK